MDKEKLKDKQSRILRKMAAEEVLQAIKEAKKVLENPGKIGDIDLNEVQRINAKLSGKVKNIEQDPGLETERYLFSFKNKFHFIESGNYRKIEDAEAKKQLDEHDDIKIYYLCTDELICPLPPALIGREGKKGVQLKDDQAVIDYIKQVTGVEIQQSDL